MRIIATSDLHYNVPRSRKPTQRIAREICQRGGDVLMFVGDSAATDLSILEQLFELFEPFKGARLAVAGNHELWTLGPGGIQLNGHDSLHRYENELAEVCSRHGVHYLDNTPFVADDIAIVGNIGWYDFSFLPAILNVPRRFYENKIAPGAAAQMPRHRHLLETDDDVPRTAREITTRWMDGERVALPLGDVDFTCKVTDKLKDHLTGVQDQAREIVVGVHHLPFAEIVPHSVLPNWEFATCFLGSARIGQTIREFPGVRHVLCGHAHRASTWRDGDFTCRSIGSTYREKQYEILDL